MRRRSVLRLVLAGLLLLPLCAAATVVQVGDTAPSLELPLLSAGDADSLSLASLRGRVVYLDFWASWCGPCRVSFPQLEQLREELGSRGFEVLAVNVDEFQADAEEFLAQLPVSYPVVRDASGDSPQRFGILGMPTGFLIDREGVVRAVHQGYRKSDGPKLRAEVLRLLEETP